MNTKTLMVAFMAVLAVFMFSFAIADSYPTVVSGEAIVSVDGIDINHGMHNNTLDLAAFAGETVPVRVFFTAADDAKDVKVKVEISSGTKDYSDSYFVGNVITNDSRVYRTGIMNVQIPAKLDDQTEDLYLRVTITADGFGSYLEEYKVSAQRNSYQLGLISVDYDATASAGDTVPVSVVIKNLGYEDSSDGFVLVAIPELGISAKGYFGDLVAVEDCDSDCGNTDAAQKIVSLKLPSSAKDGVYEMVVKVYDDDSVTTVTKQIKVSATTDTQIVSAIKNQDIRAGETKTFDLILVNSGSKVMVYNLNAASGSDLSVSVPSVVTVDAGSSKTVQVTVSAADDAEKGVYPFTVEANGKMTSFNANVVGGSAVAMSAVLLTIILVVIFVALLAVLIVLLTKKAKPTEEVETSYY
ncbi:MAG: hypothetical protein WCI72_05105 [archaeon]